MHFTKIKEIGGIQEALSGFFSCSFIVRICAIVLICHFSVCHRDPVPDHEYRVHDLGQQVLYTEKSVLYG